MVNFKRSGSIGLLTLVVLSPPALAADYLDFLKGYIGTRGPGQQSQTQALVKSNINTRQAQLETEVQSEIGSANFARGAGIARGT